MDMPVKEFAEYAAWGMQVLGLAIILAGTALAAVRYVKRLLAHEPDAYAKVRAELGRAILLGLEVLVASDIIETLLVDLSLQAVGVLGLLVLVGTMLSWALSIEIDGFVPWKRWQYEHAEAQQKPVETASLSGPSFGHGWGRLGKPRNYVVMCGGMANGTNRWLRTPLSVPCACTCACACACTCTCT